MKADELAAIRERDNQYVGPDMAGFVPSVREAWQTIADRRALLAEVDRLARELDRLRAGEDRTERDPAEIPTPGQAYARLLDSEPGERLRRLERTIEAASRGTLCSVLNHAGQIGQLRHALADRDGKISKSRGLIARASRRFSDRGTHDAQWAQRVLEGVAAALSSPAAPRGSEEPGPDIVDMILDEMDERRAERGKE